MRRNRNEIPEKLYQGLPLFTEKLKDKILKIYPDAHLMLKLN